MAAQQQILQILKTHTAYDITARFLNFQPILKLIAEQGGIRSYIIYMLYTKGKTNFWEIVKETGFTRRYISRILKELKQENIIDNELGDWFLREQNVPTSMLE